MHSSAIFRHVPLSSQHAFYGTCTFSPHLVHLGLLAHFSQQLFFYYERLTGQTRWARPEPPAQVFDSPRALQGSTSDTLLEGVVLQQAQSNDLYPRRQEHGQREDIKLHREPNDHLKLRTRNTSKDRSRIYTDTLVQHKESSTHEEEPRKVDKRRETAIVHKSFV